MKKLFLLIAFLGCAFPLFAQDFQRYCDNNDYQESVMGVQLYADGDPLKEPLIPLDNPLYRLTLSFDLLGSETDKLYYTFVHCTNDWFVTDIQRINYATGFNYGMLDNYQYSRNTLVDYVHYQLRFPEEGMRPLISGNYLLIVYADDFSEKNVYFTRRFMVFDEKAAIDVTVPRYCDDLTLSDTHQQLDIKIVMPDIMSANVQQYGNLTIRQNGRWDNAVTGLRPAFVYPDYISYEHLPQTVFEGTNQFRRVNFSTFFFNSENIEHIYKADDYYVVDYTVCEPLANKPYVSNDDIHGEKYIYVSDDGLETETEADYAWLNLFYRWPAPDGSEELYVMGGLNDWRFDHRNRMQYQPEWGGYLCQMLLKQGYYNFMFVLVDRDTGKVSTERTAGNFWDTNNVYRLYFYYYNAIKGYDELIGYTTVNSH